MIPGTKTLSSSIQSLLAQTDIKSALFNPNTVKKAKEYKYRSLMRGVNIVSYSTFNSLLLSCERKFACSKLEQNKDYDTQIVYEENIDFAFGKCVETGVQSCFLGESKQKTFFNMFLAWDMDLHAQHPKGYAKTFVDATIAIDQLFYIKEQLLQGWELAMFNGKPAIELSICIDLENGYYYVGHADIIMYHPIEGRYKVFEIKTTGLKWLHEAMYKNSDQATGYSVFLDNIAEDQERTATFEVVYLVFPTSVGHWQKYEFTKSRSARSGWINTILLDIQRINISRNINFFPKRGSSCMEYNRPCKYIDSCDSDPSSFNGTGEFAVVTEEDINKHEFDFRFKLSEIIKTQEGLL